MATTLSKRTVVIVGGGLTATLAARQLTAQGIDTLVLERGGDRTHGAETKLPTQRDELRWDTRQGTVQDWSVQTYTLPHHRNEVALPVRWMEAFLPGEGLGGGASHWNGHTWRWSEYDPRLRTRLAQRYGRRAIPADMPIQDWGTSYAEMEPYHNLFEKLFGISGKAGNIKGQLQAGGNLFDDPRLNETAKLEQMMPVASITREPGHVQAQHCANFPGAKPCHQPLKARSGYRSAGRAAEVVVNHLDVTEAQTLRLANQIVLPALTLDIHLDLRLGRLPDIDDRLAVEHGGRQTISISHRWPPLRRSRRPTSTGWPDGSTLALAAMDSSRKAGRNRTPG